MTVRSTGRLLSTVFVDYDNIYLSLKRKSEDAAKAFAKNAAGWIKEIETGRLITATNGPAADLPRRIVMNRCYGNPVPRRNAHDNATDMNSFPFVRHNFLRAGFEVIDCPPLTAQLKNSADIRMVMDVRDYLNHDTYFEEFIILSGDADFTPVLHRLRAHARRTVIFSNDYTASPYTAISDGEIREADLIAFLTEGRLPGDAPVEKLEAPATGATALPSSGQLEALRKDIIAEVVAVVSASTHAVPLEALADRAVRSLGHERTAGSAWGGAGSFRDLLVKALPQHLKVTDQPPYFVIDTSRQRNRAEQPRIEAPRPEPLRPAEPFRPEAAQPLPAEPLRSEPRTAYDAPRLDAPRQQPLPSYLDRPAQPLQPAAAAPPQTVAPAALQPAAHVHAPAQPTQRPAPQGFAPPPLAQQHAPAAQAAPAPQAALAPAPSAQPAPGFPTPMGSQAPTQQPARAAVPAPQTPRAAEGATAIQQSIARIHEACQAPPLSPPEYRVLFEVMAQEINANGLLGAQTLAGIVARAQEMGVDIRKDDVRFVLDVVSEADPWFEQGASASLFAGRFRNFVVARCRSQGLTLTSDELDLIEAWFAAGPPAARQSAPTTAARAAPNLQVPPQQSALAPQPAPQAGERWWLDDGRAQQSRGNDPYGSADLSDEFPRIVRTRQRG